MAVPSDAHLSPNEFPPHDGNAWALFDCHAQGGVQHRRHRDPDSYTSAAALAKVGGVNLVSRQFLQKIPLYGNLTRVSDTLRQLKTAIGPGDRHDPRADRACAEHLQNGAADQGNRRQAVLRPPVRARSRPPVHVQGRHGRAGPQADGRAGDGHLEKRDEILPTVQALGERHAGFGVKPEHYNTVGEALIWTLEQGLTDTFTTEVKEAWVAVYSALSSVMQDAAAEKAAA